MLLPRNLHRSLLHGCLLGGLEPLLYDVPFEAASGLWRPPTPEGLAPLLRSAGPVAALVLVSPTYHGFQADLGGLLALAAAADLPVLVDGAHGRGEAIAAGADLEVLSLQKSSGGLAQSAALLSRGGRVAPEAIERALLWLSTSSPSALLLTAAAAALGQIHRGERQRRRALLAAERLRRALAVHHLPLVPSDDPLRLVLATAAFG